MARSIPSIVIVLLQFTSCTLATSQQGQGSPDDVNSGVTDLSSASDFFAARGWIPSDGSASEIVNLGSYITNFQRYASIPITGILDKTTMDKMNSPKCGNPDFGPAGFQMTASRNKRYTSLGNPWPRNRVTWYLEGVTSDLSRSVIRREVLAAFQYWDDVSSLSFTELNSANADIIVNFHRLNHGDGSSFDGRGNTLAHAFGPGNGIGGDMHFDDDEIFVTHSGRGAGEVNFQQVAVHEIGHSLGLGHSSDNNAIMAPFYTYRANLQLGSDDVAGIQSLYVNIHNVGGIPPKGHKRPNNVKDSLERKGRPTSTATRPPMRTEKPTETMVTTPTPRRTLSPVYCNGEFDAATRSFDRDVYLFQGSQVYKVELRGDGRGFEVLHPDYPRPISEEFPGVPDFVDAAFLWEFSSSNKYLYIFKGNQYWRFQNGQASTGYPRPIRAWGLPGNIDGAFRWPGNEKIYFFKGSYYYRYNMMTGTIDQGYPRRTSAWAGVVRPLSAVLDYGTQSFFFNGQYYQEFFSATFSASEGNYQAAQTWLGCQTQGLRDYGVTTEMPEFTEMTTSVAAGLPPSMYVIVMTSLLGLYVHLSSE